MVRRLINRLFGRAGPSTDAINAYVGGNASDEEVKLVEQLMRNDPALEKDLATQKALVEVLGRVGSVQAPRSFAVTPEMVAAAEASESGISKLAELFAPQRKLALAPMVLAGFAALTVALLTIGDITGVVEQSGRSESFSTAGVGVAEIAAPAVAQAPPSTEDSVADEIVITVLAEKAIGAGADGATELEKSIAAPQAATAASAETAAPAAALAEAEIAAPAALESLESSTPGDDAGTEAPPSLSAQAPVPEEADVTADLLVEDEAARRVLPDSVDAADTVGVDETVAVESAAREGPSIEPSSVASAPEIASFERLATGAKSGVALPLWQLQVALAALVLAMIGAWAGLRQVRRD